MFEFLLPPTQTRHSVSQSATNARDIDIGVSVFLQVNEHLRDILVEEQKLREASLQESNAAHKVRTQTLNR